MQHYFGTIQDGEAFLSNEDERHFSVRRGEIGEEIELSDPSGALYLCVVSSLSPLSIKVKEKLSGTRETDIKVTIAFSLLKSDHNELIVQKATEMGAFSFLPFVSDRSIVRPKEKEDNKLARLAKIAREAATQCRRNVVPTVSPYRYFDEVLKEEADHRFLAYEGELGKGNSLFASLDNLKKGDRVLILIGPEGGFTEEEAAKARDAGFAFLSLGRRILRAETAAIYAMALLSAKGEEGA